MNPFYHLTPTQVEAMISAISDVVVLVDVQGKILFINNVGERLFATQSEVLLNKFFIDIFKITSPRVPTNFAPLQQVITNGVSFYDENLQLLFVPNGKHIICQLRIVPIKLALDGTPDQLQVKSNNSYIVVIKDISKEYEIEQTKNDFLSIAAHQLRTPLGSGRWIMEMLLNGDYGQMVPEVKDSVSQIYEINQRLTGLVNSLLDVTRIDQGRVQDAPVQTDVNELIKETLKELHPQLQMMMITVNQTNTAFGVPKIMIDAKRLREVVENLLSNAIKYNKRHGQINIFVEMTSEQQILIRIADNGVGIPAKDQNKIFGKFFRATNTSLSNTEGSGLGLFVVKSYVEGWGGKIWFTSAEGQGTTFYVTIPLQPKQHTLDHNLANQPIATS